MWKGLRNCRKIILSEKVRTIVTNFCEKGYRCRKIPLSIFIRCILIFMQKLYQKWEKSPSVRYIYNVFKFIGTIFYIFKLNNTNNMLGIPIAYTINIRLYDLFLHFFYLKLSTQMYLNSIKIKKIKLKDVASWKTKNFTTNY